MSGQLLGCYTWQLNWAWSGLWSAVRFPVLGKRGLLWLPSLPITQDYSRVKRDRLASLSFGCLYFQNTALPQTTFWGRAGSIFLVTVRTWRNTEEMPEPYIYSQIRIRSPASCSTSWGRAPGWAACPLTSRAPQRQASGHRAARNSWAKWPGAPHAAFCSVLPKSNHVSSSNLSQLS